MISAVFEKAIDVHMIASARQGGQVVTSGSVRPRVVCA